jgi:hypothetical protein
LRSIGAELSVCLRNSLACSVAPALTVAKLLPIVLIIALGVMRVGQDSEFLHASEITPHGRASWLAALLLLVFSYGVLRMYSFPRVK